MLKLILEWRVNKKIMEKLIVKIPLTINSKLSANAIYAGMHWTVRKKKKDEIILLVKSIVGHKTKTFENPVVLKMSFNSRLDVSNHSYLFKMIEDSLVSCGVLKDDTDKFVIKNILEKQKDFKGVVIEIEEIKKGENKKQEKTKK